jgi:S1-C subfamily serine protease
VKTILKKLKKAKSAVLSAVKNTAESLKSGLNKTMDFALNAVLVLAVAAGVTFSGYALYKYYGSIGRGTLNPVSEKELSRTSVMIVRSDRRSGGSGVILHSSPTRSTILTNSHVCGVIENGGVVIREGQEHAVVTFKHSSTHDLCLITVDGNFGVNTQVAEETPALYSQSIVVGHPRLLPTTVTRGHFSSRQIIEVMTGVRRCTEEDIEADEDNALLCFFLGGIPVITRYEAQLSTALISPGSSGSPVYNEDGEISGVVFAGSGNQSLAYIVPLEAVANFLNEYEKYEPLMLPNNSYEITAQFIKGQRAYVESENFRNRVAKMCKDQTATENESVQRICRIHEGDILWRK